MKPDESVSIVANSSALDDDLMQALNEAIALELMQQVDASTTEAQAAVMLETANGNPWDTDILLRLQKMYSK